MGERVCAHSHGLLVQLVPDASRHVFEDSDAARHQLQLLVLLLHDQLHTQTHACLKLLLTETRSLIKSKIFHSLPAKTAT